MRGFTMKAIIVLSVIAMLLLLGCAQQGATQQGAPGSSIQASSQTGASVQPAPSSMMTENKTGYEKTQAAIASAVADGNYGANVSYYYHSGMETVEIKLSVKGGIITDASVTGLNPVPMSAMIIGNFNAALPGLVVGKKIDQLNLPRNVAGSSLTTAAFQQYVNGLVHGSATG